MNVLILGCGRSGTSIFGELFEALPGFTYLSEPPLDAIPSLAVGHLAVKVPREAAGGSSAIGSPATVDELLAAMPAPLTVFWVIRNPFDAVCSLRPGIADGWGHHPRPPDWKDWLGRPLVEQCAHHWATINGPGYDQVRDLAVVQRFESMIADPLRTAQETAQNVGVEITPEVASSLHTWAGRVQDTNNDQFVEARTSRRRSRPDHSRRVGRWRENLTDADVDLIRPIVADAAATHGYDRA